MFLSFKLFQLFFKVPFQKCYKIFFNVQIVFHSMLKLLEVCVGGFVFSVGW